MVHYIGLQKLENHGLLQRLNSFTNSTTNIFREPNTIKFMNPTIVIVNRTIMYLQTKLPILLWVRLHNYKHNHRCVCKQMYI